MFRTQAAALSIAALFTLSATAQEARLQVRPKPYTDADAAAQPVPEPGGFVGLAYLELENAKDALTARVHGSQPGFLGAVLLSGSPATTQYLVDLPPILSEFVVMGVVHTKTQDLEIRVPHGEWPQEFKLYGQALTLDATGLSVSGIVDVNAQ